MCANLAVGRGAICRSYGAWLATWTLVAINMALLRSLAGVVRFVTDSFDRTQSVRFFQIASQSSDRLAWQPLRRSHHIDEADYRGDKPT